MPKKQKIIVLVVLLLGGGFLIYGLLTGRLLRVVRDYFSASLVTEDSSGTTGGNAADAIYNPAYSFSEDDDNDGLSNAKEVIYGTDPKNPDTDGDGHSDGEETKNGYDPSRSGDARVEARFAENLTIHYFSWAKQKTGSDDPRLESKLVDQFIRETIDTSPPLPHVADTDLTLAENNDYDTVIFYFREMDAVPLPTVASSYFDVSGEAALDNFKNVDKALNQLSVINGSLTRIPTPPVAIPLQKKYVQLVSTLKMLFGDLYLAKADPVRLTVNLERGKKLISFTKDIIIETAAIVEKYQLPENPALPGPENP